MKIYVASSWRNGYYPEVVAKLRDAGHDVYDFRNPPSGDPGFKWGNVSADYMEWSPEKYRDMLHHPMAERQFKNDIEAMEAVFEKYGEEIAALIIEPVAGNMGLILPKQGCLRSLREITEKYGTILIFDEVMCGFRASLGGAQAAYGITPDITCLGKIIGGGLPVAAYGGRRDIMDYVAPLGKVYQAGTLSGNPLAMSAGIATLEILRRDFDGVDASRALTLRTKELVLGIEAKAKEVGVNVVTHQAGSMFGIFFSKEEVWDYAGAENCDQNAFKIWFHAMLNEGIYLAPSQFETIFMSLAHTKEDIEKTVEAAGKAFVKVANGK